MTVGELIEQLEKIDRNLNVWAITHERAICVEQVMLTTGGNPATGTRMGHPGNAPVCVLVDKSGAQIVQQANERRNS